MPGFFDFTNPMAEINPGANSPMLDDVEQAGNYDFMANVPQSMPQRQPSGAPYNALAAMSGIEMPQIPQQDSMGRYGLTDDQYGDAGRQSLASILRGAAGTMFNDRPDDVIAAAAGSGDIRRGALDKASQENVNAFKLQVDAKAKELDFISKKSDIQKQEMMIEAEAMKLEDLKLKRQVAIQWGKEMAPVMSQTLQKTAAAYGPEKANALKLGFMSAQAKLALGDVDGATTVYELAISDLPEEWKRKAQEDLEKATLIAANKWALGDKLAEDPAFIQKITASGGRIERGDDGMPHIVTKSEIEMERLRAQALQEQIASERARQASYANAGGGVNGALTEGKINDLLVDAVDGANEFIRLNKPGGIKLLKDKAADDKALSTAMGKLAAAGLGNATPEQVQQFLSMDKTAQMQLIAGKVVGGGGVQGVAAPAPAGGLAANGLPGLKPGNGIKSIAVARKGFVDAARLGDNEKDAAIQALVSSGDQAIIKALREAGKDPRFAGKKKGEANVADLYSFLAGKVNVTR